MMAITGGRPGFCPEPQGKGLCVERCREDEECPRGQKCCSNGCGHVCTSLISAEKPGTCPPDPAKCRHAAPPECDSDGGCPGRKKCCFRTCAMRCIDPEEDAV
ncbi:whey acidic protein-like [Terrapene carolina triunguis]|uniref:whey acidic protein-like n=1 Tax=Terrapene triunguis TaxID=2587831 RepID=UPI001156933F|nr:whey acidic protein-like [Terrapene carolina triunguis]